MRFLEHFAFPRSERISRTTRVQIYFVYFIEEASELASQDSSGLHCPSSLAMRIWYVYWLAPLHIFRPLWRFEHDCRLLHLQINLQSAVLFLELANLSVALLHCARAIFAPKEHRYRNSLTCRCVLVTDGICCHHRTSPVADSSMKYTINLFGFVLHHSFE